jgi:acyl carrier protein
VNWVAWQETGMAFAAEAPAHLQSWKLDNLRRGLLTAEGLETFERVLQNPASQTVVSTVGLEALFDQGRGTHAQTPDEDVRANGNQDVFKPAATEAKTASRPEVQSAYRAPATDVQRKLVSIWQNILGFEPVGIHDNFFELGGHSLMALQILSRVQEDYQIALPVRTFFDASTIASLAERIEALLWVEQNKEVSSTSEDRDEFTL